MLGFHSDGVRLYGASDTLKQQLKKRKVPLASALTGNTLVFAIDDREIIQKRPHNISFAALSAPWFVCTLQGDASFSSQALCFADETALSDFIAAVYYASQEFLHLDIEFAFLKENLGVGTGKSIRSYGEDLFKEIPKDAPAICFYFGNGGFLETDRLFTMFTKDLALSPEHLTLAGSFSSKRKFLTVFAAQ